VGGRGRRGRSARRIDELLDRIGGRGGEDRKRGEEDRGRRQWRGYRTLDVRRDRELFERLVALDFDYLFCQNFAAGPRVLADLLPQSVLGRAQNGHGWFCDDYGTPLCFPDATFDRVLTVLEHTDPNLRCDAVRRRRGEMLHGFGRWLLENLDRPRLRLVIDGHPLLGVDFLGEAEVDTRAFCTGLVLAGFMDDWEHRRTAMLHHRRTFGGYPFEMGGGEILIVDREKYELCGLEDPGSNVLDDDQLRTLHDIGVICRDRHGDYAWPDHEQVFFRRRAGEGVCDDLALIMVGAKHGYDAMLGAFAMDAVDTYDKFLLTMTWGGYDTHLAGRLQRRFAETEGAPLVGDDEIFDLIHFAAKRNDPAIYLSSSHRRLIQVEGGAAVPTLLNHWRFLQGEPVYDIKLGFARVPAEKFYGVAHARLTAAGYEVPPPRFVRKQRGR
jgi:hypothetical protein